MTMVRILVITVGAVGAYIVSRRAWNKFRESGEGGGDGGPMQMLARGLIHVRKNIGPWSLSDMAIGLNAIAKVTEKEPPTMPGQEVEDLSQNPTFLLQAQHWRTISEAAYVKDSGSFSLFSSLPESSLVAFCWEAAATQEALRPAYAVVLDPAYGAVVLAVRGTSHIIDMLVNSGQSPEPFGDGGFAHGGFLHATEILYQEVKPHIEKAFSENEGTQKELKLVIVGHSMGAAVGCLMALKLREQYPDIQCWCFCPPACMSLDLAKECKSFTTSFVSAYDVVPRFSIHAVEKLRSRVQNYDWSEAERVLKDDEGFQNMKKSLDMFRNFQQSQTDAIEKMKGIDTSGVQQKVLDVKDKVLDVKDKVMTVEMSSKLQAMGKKANDFIEGKESNQTANEEQEQEQAPKLEDMPTLHPPGRLLILGSDPPGCGKLPEARSGIASDRNYGCIPSFDEAKSVTWRMLETEAEDIQEMVVSPWCISDHMLGNMCEAIGYLQSRCPPAVTTS